MGTVMAQPSPAAVRGYQLLAEVIGAEEASQALGTMTVTLMSATIRCMKEEKVGLATATGKMRAFAVDQSVLQPLLPLENAEVREMTTALIDHAVLMSGRMLADAVAEARELVALADQEG